MSTSIDEPGSGFEEKSKSQRKREAEALQNVGEKLVKLRASQLNKLNLPEKLRQAVENAQQIHSRGALRRQRQYLGRLMRDLEGENIEQSLERLLHPHVEETAYFHKLERWRDRLINEGEVAIDDLIIENPATERQIVRQYVRSAKKEREKSLSAKAARNLFKYLKALIPA